MKKHAIADSLDLTKDATLGVPLITVVGNYQVYIENYRSIIEFEAERIKILTKQGTITVLGKRLEIKYYDKEEISVKGLISKIEF